MSDTPKEEIARELSEARAATLELFDLARAERDLHESPGFGFRPVVWHLAHIGVFEGYWLLQKLRGEEPPDARYERVFDPIATPREDSKNLPSRAEMEEYLAGVRRRALDALDAADFDGRDALARGGYVFRLVVEHERQHQETLAYLLQLLDASKKKRPGAPVASVGEDAGEAAAVGGAVEVAGGEFELGASRASPFVYDNELPAHRVSLAPFRIDRRPTTNDEFAEFVEGGGYERREFWSEEGWEHRGRGAWAHPLYWARDGAGWRERRMFEEGPLRGSHPVTGVSWYEAEAYARFRGRRLPTEAEWERAAAWDESAGRRRLYAWGDDEPSDALCNWGIRRWGTTPAGALHRGASATGCLDMTGNVWEWTATPFEGFPGFEPYPYPEYSQTWFDGDHRVLKGGSWATGRSVLRTSFRNFFRRHFRIAFAGIRLAEDV